MSILHPLSDIVFFHSTRFDLKNQLSDVPHAKIIYKQLHKIWQQIKVFFISLLLIIYTDEKSPAAAASLFFTFSWPCIS